MQTVYYVQEVDQLASNVIQQIQINFLNMIALIVSVVVQLTIILTLTLQIQQIINVYYVQM